MLFLYASTRAIKWLILKQSVGGTRHHKKYINFPKYRSRVFHFDEDIGNSPLSAQGSRLHGFAVDKVQISPVEIIELIEIL